MPKTALKLEDFDILQTIGTGTFGVCKKVRRKSDGKVSLRCNDGNSLIAVDFVKIISYC